MKIDYCLILSAGFGTRMGEIGKILPKALWPLFDKTFLEAQIYWIKELGCNKIFVNTHFLHEKIEAFIEADKNLDITVLHEKELLNTGGAIYNLKNKYGLKSGTLLLIAGDQFYFFDKKLWKKAFDRVTKISGLLFGLKVCGEKEFYNELVLENGFLKNIVNYNVKNHSKREYITYSGLGLINLDFLDEGQGSSSFFETVADFRKKKIEVHIPEANEYWDFGSKTRYYNGLYSLLGIFLKNEKSDFLSFCCRHNIFNPKKAKYKLKSYGTSCGPEIIDLSEGPNVDSGQCRSSIILKRSEPPSSKRRGIIYGDIFDKLEY
jgi:mannose-1-phosphate guanylyltransferase